ncbi:MerR family transcriptional regulator [Arthrobacter sunyaminii]|uniref:MerR family transcriptional regulator n=1 Tax=Arthrobacter sunyaminii TaxID=2816859 RepID=A0A975XL73_9MICC|nr:MerR family transcriptional regulator [Arthrobacter sunyaminii]MBO0907735.1 MerR family transcriptional regulator [Arthrobacter sunyaminii]QWQ36801.1 MerR family transcriptional regulator [Arthrobacter sunyaminii]
MAWSTRELAELAKTTVNTIRHYHRLGLLEEPDRRYNGYKQYEGRHLVSLLRIRRLAELGVPLSQMHEVGTRSGSTPDVLHDIDAELKKSIERLQEARAHIAAIIAHRAPADVPAGFEAVASRLSENDNAVIHLMSHLYDGETLTDVLEMTADETDDTGPDIDRLPADADEETRQELAGRMAEVLARNMTDYPWLGNPASLQSDDAHFTTKTVGDILAELYNPAQLDVMMRAGVLAAERVQAQKRQASQQDQASQKGQASQNGQISGT